MVDYIETQTKDGAKIRIEVESGKTGAGFSHQSSISGGSSQAAKNAYSQTLDTIRACANGVVDTIQNLEALPSAASINFAIKIDAEAGAMIAKSGSEAQFKVLLSWKQVEPEPEEKKKEE